MGGPRAARRVPANVPSHVRLRRAPSRTDVSVTCPLGSGQGAKAGPHAGAASPTTGSPRFRLGPSLEPRSRVGLPRGDRQPGGWRGDTLAHVTNATSPPARPKRPRGVVRGGPMRKRAPRLTRPSAALPRPRRWRSPAGVPSVGRRAAGTNRQRRLLPQGAPAGWAVDTPASAHCVGRQGGHRGESLRIPVLRRPGLHLARWGTPPRNRSAAPGINLVGNSDAQLCTLASRSSDRAFRWGGSASGASLFVSGTRSSVSGPPRLASGARCRASRPAGLTGRSRSRGQVSAFNHTGLGLA
jgi:hypothetical protein